MWSRKASHGDRIIAPPPTARINKRNVTSVAWAFTTAASGVTRLGCCAKGIPGELLFAYLRLPVICELMDLHTTASMYPAISTTDLMRLPFLLPDDATIKTVKQQITAARAARREAHALLEKAKQAVEIAIEENEAAGMALLKG